MSVSYEAKPNMGKGNGVESQVSYNQRKLMELPFQQTHSQNFTSYSSSLYNFAFIEAKASAGMLNELLDDYETALLEVRGVMKEVNNATSKITQDEIEKHFHQLTQFQQFLQKKAHLLRKSPKDVLMIAMNGTDGQYITEQAKEQRSRNAVFSTKRIFSLQNKPLYQDPCLMTMVEHREHNPYFFATALLCPGDQNVVSTSVDSTFTVWDLKTGKELINLKGHTGWIVSIVVSADGSKAYTASKDKTLKSWNIVSGNELLTFVGHTDEVHTCALTPDGSKLVSGSYDKTLKVWDVKNGKELLTLRGHTDQVLSCFTSPDGSKVLSASIDKTARVWDIATGSELLLIDSCSDYSLWVLRTTVAPDWSKVATYTEQKFAVYDLATGSQLLAIPYKINCGLFVAKDKILVGLKDALALWDISTGNAVWTIGDLNAWDAIGASSVFMQITSVVLSADGKKIVAGSRDKTIKIFDFATGAEVMVLSGHHESVNMCAITADGKKVVSFDGSATKVWDITTTQKVSFIGHPDDQVNGCVIFPHGKKIISGSRHNTHRIWDIATTHLLLPLIGYFGPTLVAVTPDESKIIVATQENAICVLDALTGTVLFTLSHEDGYYVLVVTIVLTPDGKTIISGSSDGTIKVWNLADGKQLHEIKAHTHPVEMCAVTTDGSKFVSSSLDKKLKLWDIATGKELLTFVGHTKTVYLCVVTPDGKKLISGSDDKTLKVWDITTGKELASFSGHSGTEQVKKCIFAPDGNKVLTATRTGAPLVWDINTGLLITNTQEIFSAFASVRKAKVVCQGVGNELHLYKVEDGYQNFDSFLVLDGEISLCELVGDNKVFVGCTNGAVQFFKDEQQLI